ncbi:MAG TPA: UTP--glucose-1-phosphate uridylyltransferase GalU [Ktedonobacterales bacterium]|jgi:UTP--glucose-1-phosphate uridylyltransferase|nr:UTP--glucose-1-phosphate uridylyltransferase GalU [Ktedonobacterales bacterium]
MKIRKAVIPAAGLGTRVLPATKAIPKEMLPLADKPTIQYIIEEAVASGIEHIIVVTSRTKRAIEDHFDESPELRAALEKKGDTKKLQMFDHIENMAQISFTRQPRPRGLGHAILMAKDLVGDEPFGVLLGDDLVVNRERPCLKQLMEVHERHGGCVIAALRVPPEQTKLYGVFDLERGTDLEPRTHRVGDLVEKPQPEQAPSDLAVIGRYVLTPDIFPALEQTEAGAGGEIQLTDGIRALRGREPIYAYEFDGTRYDTGDPVSYLTTSLAFALERPDLAPGIVAYLKTLRLD